MQNSDDFISLREFRDDEDAIFTFLEAAMKSIVYLYVQSRRSPQLILLSPSQLQDLRSEYPGKVLVKIETETRTTYNKLTGKSSSHTIEHEQFTSFSDLWIKKIEAKPLLKKPILTPSLSESEKATMLRLILGMAMGAYDYDPDETRNPATGSNKGSIKADLEKYGLTIDGNTVRKYLEEAKAMYPHVKCKDNKKIFQD